MAYIPYNKNNNVFAGELRNNSTKGEVLLWKILKAKKMRGYAFNRQKPLGNFIVDFYCKALKLVIEIDVISHSFSETAYQDSKKQEYLQSIGLTVLRFTEKEVIFQRPQVIEAIQTYMEIIESREI